MAYLVGIIALVGVEFFGITAKGAQRWINFPGLPQFQPSELMKWIVPLTVASYLSKYNLPPGLGRVLVVMLIVFIPMLLIMSQPDLGTALLLGSSGLAVLFLAGWRWRHMFVFGMMGLATLPVLWKFVLHDYQRRRILTMLFPDNDPFGAGWSISQSKVAIGSGGWFGKGWMNGSQSQLEFLPESDTDFIMAVLAEEGGLIGVLILLLMYMVILMRCALLSLRAPDNFGRLFSSGLVLMFSLFIFVNMAMVSGLLPVVGVPLPLISRGGSALVSSLVAFGLLMSVCSQQGRIVR
jgi:rod shape determining protein RodA